MKTKIIIAALILIVLQSCKMENTPEEYFDISALNTNLFMEFGSKDFERMEQNKNGNQLMAFDEKSTFPAKSYEDHILRFKVPYLKQSIKKIEDLKPTDETTPMINASLDLFKFVEDKYEKDYVKIAKLMDQKASKETIDKAIAEMEAANFPVFEEKYKKLWDLALPYAKDHGIEVNTF
ncbi:hypothetical protein IRZ71_10875 [Flavobacterium sp. ANB]|uniref:hypothetical protein n=1 Tax=unclassified Flavobacterium TaxID=196869 RepID=UPI0012B72BD1|nr:MULTISPECIES: hypothetical protein [unclassified Flavobacterium]MBF4516853.1 hypothetical protein [Flavobacterium sp. ANB]MTD69251.1 hypothetical protein [Flavobacterium sp. LC2016-13]